MRVRLPPSPPAGFIAKTPPGQKVVSTPDLRFPAGRIAIFKKILRGLTRAHKPALIVVGKKNSLVDTRSDSKGATYAGTDASRISLRLGRRGMICIL